MSERVEIVETETGDKAQRRAQSHYFRKSGAKVRAGIIPDFSRWKVGSSTIRSNSDDLAAIGRANEAHLHRSLKGKQSRTTEGRKVIGQSCRFNLPQIPIQS